MPTLFVSGDLFHHPGLKAFAHGCNCAGAMGKGIALEFRERLRADIQAIETALARMLAAAVATQIERIGLPRVGAGLGACRGRRFARCRKKSARRRRSS